MRRDLTFRRFCRRVSALLARLRPEKADRIDENRPMTTSRYRNIRFAGALCVPGVVMTLFAQQNDSLSVVGQSGSARVARISGKDYVEVEGLVRLMRGSIRFNGNEIVVTWDSANGNSPAPPEPGFSKAFVTAGIEAMAEQREWRAALKNAIESLGDHSKAANGDHLKSGQRNN